jgi:phenylacetate-CoA ligase
MAPLLSSAMRLEDSVTLETLSSLRELVWPAIVDGDAATVLSTLFQLEQSQWWSPEEISAHQYKQLDSLLRHARNAVPFHEERLRDAKIHTLPLTPEIWRTLPLLRREDVRRRRQDLESRHLPSGHGATHAHKTSGSTGEPLEVLGTGITGLFWESLSLRDDLWHRRDVRGRLVAIRSGRYAKDPLEVRDEPAWGFVWPPVFVTGPMTIFFHRMPLTQQVEILEARRPRYLLTYPSNARALCRFARRRPVRLPDLEAVLTYGEPLSPDVRVACREAWGVPVHDVYGCEEVGYVALQCPEHEHYHVQSESVLVEVLDERGNPCSQGQVGEVVLTSLHNFEMPMIRYAIGDFAEVGAPCPCGRGLPVLRRVFGKKRGAVALPDGRRAWPDIGAIWAAIPDVVEVQVVQRGASEVDVLFARDRPLTAGEERDAGRRIRRALGYPFSLTFTRVDSIARQVNGKYETFQDAR